MRPTARDLYQHVQFILSDNGSDPQVKGHVMYSVIQDMDKVMREKSPHHDEKAEVVQLLIHNEVQLRQSHHKQQRTEEQTHEPGSTKINTWVDGQLSPYIEKDVATTTIIQQRSRLEVQRDNVCTALTLQPEASSSSSRSHKTINDTSRIELLHATTLAAHQAQVISALLISKKLLFSGSHDNTIKVWDMDTNICIVSLEGHQGPISCLAISTRRNQLLSGSWDNTIRVWDLNTLLCLYTLSGHSHAVRALLIDDSSDRLYSASHDRTIMTWDLSVPLAPIHIHTMWEHTGSVLCLALSPILNRLYSGSEDTIIRVFDLDLPLNRCISLLHGHSKSVDCLVLAPDYSRLYSGSQDHTIKVWDINTNVCQLTLTGHSNWVRCLVYCFKTHRLISGSADNTIKVWDMTTNDCLQTAKGQNRGILSLALSEDHDFLYSGSGSETPGANGSLIDGWHLIPR
jgi:WD40 repeat protein